MPEADDVEELFVAVRRGSSANGWSRGVELARGGSVSLRRDSDGELELGVTDPKTVVTPTVTLYPEDAEWDCTCGGADPCLHVAAATIALKQSLESGEPLGERTEQLAQLEYRLRSVSGGMLLDRFVRCGDQETRLQTTLAARLQQIGAVPLEASQADLNLDRALTGRPRGAINGETIASWLEQLESVRYLSLDGKPVTASNSPITPRAAVENASGGFRVTVAAPTKTKIVAAGLGLVENCLHALGETALSGKRWQNLPSVREFSGAQVTELVTKVLPGLKERLPLDIRTRRLPKMSEKLEARIHLEVSQEDGVLHVLPTIVYGDPPQARVDGDDLVPLEKGSVPIRNRNAERRVAERMQRELELLPGRKARLIGAAAVEMARKLDAWQGGLSGKEEGRFIENVELGVRLGVSGDAGFELSFDGTGDGGRALTARAEDVVRAWEGNVGLVPLLEGGFARLPQEWLDTHGHRVAQLLDAKRSDGELEKHAIPTLAKLCDALNQPRPPGFEKLTPLLDGFKEIPVAELPSDLCAELRPYQREGIDWLSFMRTAGLGATLADDMGLGKTLQAIAVLQGSSLVVAPTSVIHNWASELARFRPGLTTNIYHGTKRKLDPDVDVTITSYALLRLDQDLLAKRHWDCLVLDEAQSIKNPESQVAQAAFQVGADFRLTLSGTPVENRLDELWSQLHFTNPGLLGGRSDFQERYAKPIGFGVPGAAKRLRDRIGPFVLRRVKKDVAKDLPPRTDVVIRCELSPTERAVYDSVYAATQEEVVQQLTAGGNVLHALEALLRLRQAACHSGLLPGQTANTSAKVERLVESLEIAAADGHRALVFSQWTSFLNLMEPALTAAGLDFCRLDGSTRDRQGVVAQFQSDDGPPVMLLSLKAGGTGLNLTAADHVFLMDLWWNPAVEEQAADRAHRIGQDNPVLVHRIVAKDTVEERILALQDEKRSLADAALGDAEQAASLSREDLLRLLS